MYHAVPAIIHKNIPDLLKLPIGSTLTTRVWKMKEERSRHFKTRLHVFQLERETTAASEAERRTWKTAIVEILPSFALNWFARSEYTSDSPNTKTLPVNLHVCTAPCIALYWSALCFIVLYFHGYIRQGRGRDGMFLLGKGIKVNAAGM